MRSPRLPLEIRKKVGGDDSLRVERLLVQQEKKEVEVVRLRCSENGGHPHQDAASEQLALVGLHEETLEEELQGTPLCHAYEDALLLSRRHAWKALRERREAVVVLHLERFLLPELPRCQTLLLLLLDHHTHHALHVLADHRNVTGSAVEQRGETRDGQLDDGLAQGDDALVGGVVLRQSQCVDHAPQPGIES